MDGFSIDGGRGNAQLSGGQEEIWLGVLGVLDLRENMTCNGSIQRNNRVFNFRAGHRYEPVPGIFTVIF